MVACAPLLKKRSSQVSARVTTPGLLEARSRRRDDGRGQTGIGSVALRPRLLDWPASSTFKPLQVAATCRPRTEARLRRLGDARGIDNSRPVTEEPISKSLEED